MVRSVKTHLVGRILLFIVSTALAVHSSHRIVLFHIPPRTFYPFNFLLFYPSSVVDWWWKTSKEGEGGCAVTGSFYIIKLVIIPDIPITLFNFLLLGVLVRRIWVERRRDEAKKIF